MAKRKKRSKKTNQRVVAQPRPSVEGGLPAAVEVATPVVAAEQVEPWAYVKADVKRIAILAAFFFALELGLWYLFNSTGLGASIYSLVSV
jgi:hypothetical protein